LTDLEFKDQFTHLSKTQLRGKFVFQWKFPLELAAKQMTGG